MALMSFREPNQVKWRGWRPCHRGEQVALSFYSGGAAATVYEVPAGKTLHLISAHTMHAAWAARITSLAVTTPAHAIKYFLTQVKTRVLGQNITKAFEPCVPLLIAAGDKIRYYRSGPSTYFTTFIFGWLE